MMARGGWVCAEPLRPARQIEPPIEPVGQVAQAVGFVQGQRTRADMQIRPYRLRKFDG